MADTLSSLVRQGGQTFSGGAVTSSPMESAVSSGTSASPDVAKMAGTPASTRSSSLKQLRQDRPNDLATTQRLAQGEGQGLKDVQAKYHEDIQKFQQMGNHLAAMATAQTATEVGKAVSGAPTTPRLNSTLANTPVPADAVQGLPNAADGKAPDTAQELVDIINSSASAEQKQQAVVALSKIPGGPTSQAELSGWIDKNSEDAATVQSRVTSQDFTVSDLSPAQIADLGFPDTTDAQGNVVTGISQMAKALGLPDDKALSSLTIDQLVQTVNQVKQGKHSTADDWRAVASDPTASDQDRATAREMLAGMGQGGVVGDEAQMASIQAQVDGATQVNWPGIGTVSISSLLSNKDGILSKQIKAALTTGDYSLLPDSVATLVQQHDQVFKQALKDTEGVFGQVAQVVKQNQDAVKGVPEDVVKKLGLTPGAITNKPMAVPAAISSFSSLSPQDQAGVVDVLSKVPEASSLSAQDLLHLTDGWNPDKVGILQENAQPTDMDHLQRGGGYAKFGTTTFPISSPDQLSGVLANLSDYASKVGVPLPPELAQVKDLTGLQALMQSHKGLNADWSPRSLVQQVLKGIEGTKGTVSGDITLARMSGKEPNLSSILGSKSPAEIDAAAAEAKAAGADAATVDKQLQEAGIKEMDLALQPMGNSVASLKLGLKTVGEGDAQHWINQLNALSPASSTGKAAKAELLGIVTDKLNNIRKSASQLAEQNASEAAQSNAEEEISRYGADSELDDLRNRVATYQKYGRSVPSAWLDRIREITGGNG